MKNDLGILGIINVPLKEKSYLGVKFNRDQRTDIEEEH